MIINNGMKEYDGMLDDFIQVMLAKVYGVAPVSVLKKVYKIYTGAAFKIAELAQTRCETSLWIAVHQQDFLTGSGKTDAEIRHDSGLVRPAFLITAAVNLTHSFDLPSCLVMLLLKRLHNLLMHHLADSCSLSGWDLRKHAFQSIPA